MILELEGLRGLVVEDLDVSVRVVATLSNPGPRTVEHFPGHPVVPGFVLMTWIFHIARSLGISHHNPLLLDAVKFNAVLRGGEKVVIELNCIERILSKFRIATNDEIVLHGIAKTSGGPL